MLQRMVVKSGVEHFGNLLEKILQDKAANLYKKIEKWSKYLKRFRRFFQDIRTINKRGVHYRRPQSIFRVDEQS